MSWGRPPETLTSDVYCPYCARQGRKQRLACELHRWAYRQWYEGEQKVFARYATRGFFAKPRDNYARK